MEQIPKQFGLLLKNLRTKKGISKTELANEAQLDRSYVRLLEAGMRQPTLTTIFKIGKVLGVRPSSLIRLLEDVLQ